MSTLKHDSSLSLFFGLLLIGPALGCGDDGGENLTEGGFTTGEQTSTGPTSSPTSNSGSTTQSTTASTSSTTNVDSSSSTTDESTSSNSGDSSSSSSSSDTTETTSGSSSSSSSDSSSSSSSSTTGMPGTCDNASVDADEVCFVSGGTVDTSTTPTDIAAGNFNGDGSFDVIVSGNDEVSVHLSDGTGALGAAIVTSVGTGPVRVVAGELSGDANWDAVVANSDDDTISILIADGVGGFTETILGVGDQPVDLALGDLDGANGLDIAVANFGDVNYNTTTNDGAGTFTLLGPWTPAGAVVEMSGIAMGSIALGGTIDAFYGGGDFYAATNGVGDGTMSAQSLGGTAGTLLSRFNPGDINGDGDLDVVAADGDDARVYLGLGNDGNAGFNSNSFGPHTGVSEAILADVTGEGTEDLVLVSDGDDQVAVYVGNGDATFEDAVLFDVGATPTGLAAADINDDGVLDILVCDSGDSTVSILLSNP